MKEIILNHGKRALVDDEDYEWLTRLTWYAMKPGNTNNYYAYNSKGRVFMHSLVMNAAAGQQVDHRNGDGLDNRKENLRFTSNAQNQYNRRLPGNSTSGYKGVSWNKKSRKWQAQIAKDKKPYYLGLFDTAEAAARAYDAKARELFGEFAKPNFAQ